MSSNLSSYTAEIMSLTKISKKVSRTILRNFGKEIRKNKFSRDLEIYVKNEIIDNKL